MKRKILVVCTGNSARSQMAEALLRRRLGLQFEIYSAGVDPKPVRPEAVAVMAEAGIDISDQRSRSVAEFAGVEFAIVMTVCDAARETCPVFPGNAERIHWSFDDPAAAGGGVEKREAVFRRVRDEIAVRVEEFAVERGW